MENNTPINPLAEIFIGLGYDDPSPLFGKQEDVKPQEVIAKIIAHQRALISTDSEFINPYVEQGRQETYSKFNKVFVQHFDVKESDLVNKSEDEIAKMIKTKTQAGMSQTSKDFEDKITNLKKENDGLRAQITQLTQNYEKERTINDIKADIKLAISKLPLSSGLKSAQNHVIKELLESGDFLLTREGSTIIVSNSKGQRFRPEKWTKPQPLTFEETIEYLLSQENMLQKQPNQNKGTEQRTQGFGGLNNATPEPRNQNVSPEVLENHRRLQEKFAFARA
jgi:hypothetical protein